MSSLSDWLERAKRVIPSGRPARRPEPKTPMEKTKALAERLWKDHRREVLAAAAVLAALVVVLGYLTFKRPGDVFNSGAAFNPFEKPVRGTVEWKTYGLDNQRTRFLPRHGLRPPFKRRWEYTTGGTLTEFSPVMHDGNLYGIDNDAEAFSLEALTGKVRWKRKVGELSAASPAFDDGRVFMVNLEPGQALAVDADNGETIWERNLPGRSESSPAVEDGKVIFGCECGKLFALSVVTGKTVWERDLGGALKGGPAINDGVAFIGDYNGKLSAVNIDDGTIKWQSDSSGGSFGRAGSFYASPTVAFGRVYIGSKDSRMYSFEEETGELAWSHSTGAEVYASAAVADTEATPPSVYFGGLDGKIYALDAETGEERWSEDAGGSVIGAGSVIGQIFYVANVSKRATAGFATRDGKRVFGVHAGAYNPMISDGKQLYLTTYAGVVAMKTRPGGSRSKEEKAAEKKQQGG